MPTVKHDETHPAPHEAHDARPAAHAVSTERDPADRPASTTVHDKERDPSEEHRERERHGVASSRAHGTDPVSKPGKRFKPGDHVKLVAATKNPKDDHPARGKRCRIQGYVTRDGVELVSCVSEDNRCSFDIEEARLKPV